MQPVRIAIIIVTFNRCDMLRKNLESLKAQGNLSYFIIDNNSHDNTRKVVKTFEASTSHPLYYYNTQANLGGAGGFEYGCKKALAHHDNFTHLWLTDDDVTFHPNCLAKLMPFINERRILQPMRFQLSGENAEASATKIDLCSPLILNHKRNSVMGSTFKHKRDIFDLHNIPFEGPLIPRAVFTQIGLPDPRYFIFSDDLDFSLRAREKGFTLHCIPNAKMTRLNPIAPDIIPKNWKGYFVYRNLFRIQKKFGQNCFVQNRPILITFIIASLCLITLNWGGVKRIFHALLDGLSKDFPINPKYIP